MKQTQCQQILAYLRKHKTATNMELVQNLWIAAPWRRISEMQEKFLFANLDMLGRVAWGQVTKREKITRTTIKTNTGKRVTQYRLERVK